MTSVRWDPGAQPVVFVSEAEYNLAYPDAPIPADVGEREAMTRFTNAGTGLVDDLTDTSGAGSEVQWLLEFLPGGIPGPGEEDRNGVVLASRWGEGPYVVLAEGVSLRRAWEVLATAWPETLSDAWVSLRVLRAEPPLLDRGARLY